MKRLLILPAFALPLFALAWLSPATRGDDQKPYPPMGTIERIDPAFNKLIPTTAVLEQLAGGFAWTEGPVWVKKDGGYLLFSDIPNNRVVKWQEGKGVTDFLKPAGYTGTNNQLREPGSNGLKPGGDTFYLQTVLSSATGYQVVPRGVEELEHNLDQYPSIFLLNVPEIKSEKALHNLEDYVRQGVMPPASET